MKDGLETHRYSMKPWRFLSNVSDTFDGIEVGIVFLLGTLLGAALVVGVPVWMAWTLIRGGRPVLGGLFAALLALTILGVVRDLRARRMSWLSAVLAALWTLCVGYVGVRMMLA